MNYVIAALAVTALCTYLPKFLMFLIPAERFKSRFLLSFFHYIPFAVLGAMTFPAIFFATDSLVASAVGAAVAVVLSLFERRMITVALGAILATALCLLIF